MILYALCALLAVALGLLWVVYSALISRVELLEESRLRHRAEIDALKAAESMRARAEAEQARLVGMH